MCTHVGAGRLRQQPPSLPARVLELVDHPTDDVVAGHGDGIVVLQGRGGREAEGHLNAGSGGQR